MESLTKSINSKYGGQCDLKVYDEKYAQVELEAWIRGIEKIFTIVEVPEDKKVKLRTFYLTEEVHL